MYCRRILVLLFCLAVPLELYPNTDPKHVGELYACMNIVNKVLAEHNITYWADGGALLGAIRHGGFIPWDFDIDLEIHEEDLPRLLNLREFFMQYNMYFVEIGKKSNWGLWRLCRDYINSSGQKKQAIIEFYLTHQDKDKIVLNMTDSSGYYEKSFWFASDVEKVDKMEFGPIYLNVAQNPIDYITRYYGQDALTQAGHSPDIKVFKAAEYIWPDDIDEEIVSDHEKDDFISAFYQQ